MALLDKVGSLSIQTRAEELVAAAEVKNCVGSERDGVKNCKMEHSVRGISTQPDGTGKRKNQTLPLN